MVSEKWISTVLLLQLCWASYGFCGKVLVWPCDKSHWLNMKTILEELIDRGHEVTVLIRPNFVFIDYKNPPALKFEVIPLAFQKITAEKESQELMDVIINDLTTVSSWQATLRLNNYFIKLNGFLKQVCENIVYNKTLMRKLQEENYDVMFIDPVLPCGELVAELLGLPFVLSIRTSPGGTAERHCGKLPAPLSYVPVVSAKLTDRMTFLERVKNSMISVLFYFQLLDYDFYYWKEFYSEVLGRPTSLCEILGKADIWLIRTFWDFEFPQPYLPNFEFVGGLHCKPAKPLPKEMEEFVQSSGEDGIVVFSLGSVFQNLPEDKADLIASALAQIPQKVVWKHTGKKPDTLGANTQIYDWIPQNDLLGHPKTKAFITHGGINGIYEAIYHGIPMVGIPLFSDQTDNISHMKTKGAAMEVNFHKMTSADLINALRTVISEPSYKENIMRLSRIHHDQPVKPLDRAVFWIEFVMRHKGAKHLRAAVHDLTWVQYHSIDVIGFLLACIATLIFLLLKCCSFTYKKRRKTGKKKKW